MSGPEPPRPPSPPAPPTTVLPVAGETAKRPWWQRGWGVAAIAVAGLIVGAGIGTAGKSTAKTVTDKGTTTTVQAAATPVRTITHVVVHTHTVTTQAPAETKSSEESSSGSAGSYSGSGTKSLGTITILQPSTIHWRATGGVFGITGATANYEHSIALSSKAASGESAVEPGTYNNVQVLAFEEWSFTIDPG
jgi:hypothetical protein